MFFLICLICHWGHATLCACICWATHCCPSNCAEHTLNIKLDVPGSREPQSSHGFLFSLSLNNYADAMGLTGIRITVGSTLLSSPFSMLISPSFCNEIVAKPFFLISLRLLYGPSNQSMNKAEIPYKPEFAAENSARACTNISLTWCGAFSCREFWYQQPELFSVL